jgi:hypothetical protein
MGLGLCGLRLEEVLRVLAQDVNESEGALFVRTAKKGVPRTIQND